MIPAGTFALRPYRHEDAAEMSAAVRESTPTVGRWMGWAKPDFSAYDALCWFDHCSQARAAGTAHEFGIFDLDGGFVGACGLNRICTLNKFCNLGYWVRQSRQRSGAATAAVHALCQLGFDHLELARIEIVVAVDNLASIGVARKAGASHECIAASRLQVQGKATPAHVFAFTG